MMNKETQETFLYGYNTVDCCVRKKNIFYFVVREDYTRWPKSKWDGDSSGPPEGDVEKRVLAWFRDKKDANAWSNTFLRGIDIPICEAPTKPKEHFVGVAGTDVYSMGSGDGGFEKDISRFSEGGPFRGNVGKGRVIDGWLYVCGGNNSVGKRTARGEWHSFTPNIPNPGDQAWLDNGFDDIDGFSESDIYCAGGKGFVFHFNGKDWRALAFPSNTDLQSICCAGDGNVYISGMHGVVFKGRGEKWKNIHKAQPAGMVLGFKDMVWYEDRVWCTSDYGLWTIHNDKLTQADVPDFVRACSGNLSVADGVLLLAGYGGAAFRENGQWYPIY
ncbi:MAG: hypothetical protein H7293_02690 [Candidatus Saccharibacteria bacterium]|nr:hypothetical protein [Rhodoferax sp.]